MPPDPPSLGLLKHNFIFGPLGPFLHKLSRYATAEYNTNYFSIQQTVLCRMLGRGMKLSSI